MSSMDAFVAPQFLAPVRGQPVTSGLCFRRPVVAPRVSMAAAPQANTDTSTTSAKAETVAPKAGIDWDNLGFKYNETRCHVRMTCKDGVWGAPELVYEPYIKIHIGATALHYGCAAFEGLKCYRSRDGSARLFRPDENMRRMERSADRLMVPRVPQDMWMEAVRTAVRENAMYIPPYGTGGSLYVRPLIFGSGARIGLNPADEFTFMVMVTPVGDYYKGGLAPVTAIVTQGYDRAAPNGMGNVKVAGNYAADLLPNMTARKAGYPINLYLDAENKQTIEEFGTSNFIALKGNSYVTPNSKSVLPSITNKTLMQLARDRGMTVEEREVDIHEVSEFEEAAACGTAVVITAVTRVLYGDKLMTIGSDPDVVGERLRSLYDEVRGIQFGEIPDRHGWCHAVENA